MSICLIDHSSSWVDQVVCLSNLQFNQPLVGDSLCCGGGVGSVDSLAVLFVSPSCYDYASFARTSSFVMTEHIFVGVLLLEFESDLGFEVDSIVPVLTKPLVEKLRKFFKILKNFIITLPKFDFVPANFPLGGVIIFGFRHPLLPLVRQFLLRV